MTPGISDSTHASHVTKAPHTGNLKPKIAPSPIGVGAHPNTISSPPSNDLDTWGTVVSYCKLLGEFLRGLIIQVMKGIHAGLGIIIDWLDGTPENLNTLFTPENTKRIEEDRDLIFGSTATTKDNSVAQTPLAPSGSNNPMTISQPAEEIRTIPIGVDSKTPSHKLPVEIADQRRPSLPEQEMSSPPPEKTDEPTLSEASAVAGQTITSPFPTVVLTDPYEELPLSDEAKEKIKSLITTLGTSSYFELMRKKDELETLGNEIDKTFKVHPLKFLECVFNSTELKKSIDAILQSSILKIRMTTGIKDNIGFYKASMPSLIAGFAQALNVDLKHLLSALDIDLKAYLLNLKKKGRLQNLNIKFELIQPFLSNVKLTDLLKSLNIKNKSELEKLFETIEWEKAAWPTMVMFLNEIKQGRRTSVWQDPFPLQTAIDSPLPLLPESILPQVTLASPNPTSPSSSESPPSIPLTPSDESPLYSSAITIAPSLPEPAISSAPLLKPTFTSSPESKEPSPPPYSSATTTAFAPVTPSTPLLKPASTSLPASTIPPKEPPPPYSPKPPVPSPGILGKAISGGKGLFNNLKSKIQPTSLNKNS